MSPKSATMKLSVIIPQTPINNKEIYNGRKSTQLEMDKADYQDCERLQHNVSWSKINTNIQYHDQKQTNSCTTLEENF